MPAAAPEYVEEVVSLLLAVPLPAVAVVLLDPLACELCLLCEALPLLLPLPLATEGEPLSAAPEEVYGATLEALEPVYVEVEVEVE